METLWRFDVIKEKRVLRWPVLQTPVEVQGQAINVQQTCSDFLRQNSLFSRKA